MSTIVDFDIEVECEVCGDPLDASWSINRRTGDCTLKVEVCGSCKDTACDESHSEGYDEGHAAGIEEMESANS